MINPPLKFSRGSSFYPEPTWEFNLPAGHSCPGALKCLTFADRATGRQTAGLQRSFKCYAANVERYPAVREQRWHNFMALKKCGTVAGMAHLILESIPKGAERIRIHGGGDFFSQEYFDAWLSVCFQCPGIRFWAFTKSIPFWLNRLNDIPKNMLLTASMGGRHDMKAWVKNLPSATVYENRKLAVASGLPIDTDDTIPSAVGHGSFALIDRFAK